ncbi:MAG: M48 family metallopeptidase [Candidatus Eremiobacteraeota bacterium]|nr:M48 family metallopeptidase [Candidatus Eremiobacteraeota bacterium]
MKKFWIGACAGIAAGYLAARAFEAWREWHEPSPPLEKDAAAYAATRRSIEVAETVRGIAGLVGFAYGPIAGAIDRATLPAPPWLRPALFIVPLGAVSAALDFPVAFVQDYTLERRYGLSDQSRESWIADYVKSSALSIGVSALIASLFGIAVRHAPRAWPWIAGAGVFPLLVLANVVVPLWILPLFNEFEPVTGSLEERLRKLADRFGVGDAEILRMNMSKQTRKANAFVTGVGHTHRIVLGDTLIEAFPENEIEFVVAHELGHYVSKDTWRSIGVAEVMALVLFLTARSATPESERDDLRKNPLLIVRFYAVAMLASQVLRPLLFAFSRSREWAADRFALDTTHDAPSGASAFRRLRDQNLADEDPPGWYEFFFSSHPSLKNRIAALREA